MQMSRNVKLINIVLLKSSTNQANLQTNASSPTTHPTLVAASDYCNPNKAQIKATSTRKLIIKTDKKSKIIIRANQDAEKMRMQKEEMQKNTPNTPTHIDNFVETAAVCCSCSKFSAN